MTQWLKHLGQIQGLEFISLESMSSHVVMGPCIILELVEIGSRERFLATLVRIGESVGLDP